ncbi:SCP2 sterol-binding domain-containing protein [Candidatus Bathyarchaeota archaeon]|nr:SCP2 sterol-binding domain-containing protein [Candidatus Bathyarchaeota archaeon]
MEERMTAIFPSFEWLEGLSKKLNSDTKYVQIARNWEGDMCVVIEPSGPLTEQLLYYLDLWHGKCRKTEILKDLSSVKPKFVLTATYDNISRIMKGGLDPMTAMMTRKLQVHGSMAYMMRNVPTVLDFVRCAREVTTEILS